MHNSKRHCTRLIMKNFKAFANNTPQTVTNTDSKKTTLTAVNHGLDTT